MGEKKRMDEIATEYETLSSWLKNKLADYVQSVEVSDRLVDSPAAIVQGDFGMSPMMQRYMKAQAAAVAPDSDGFGLGARNQAILEINPNHAVVQKLKFAMETAPDAQETEDMATMLYETAALLGGYALENPGDFAKRVTRLMETLEPK